MTEQEAAKRLLETIQCAAGDRNLDADPRRDFQANMRRLYKQAWPGAKTPEWMGEETEEPPPTEPPADQTIDLLKDHSEDDADNAAAGLNRDLELEYEKLWDTMVLKDKWKPELDRIVQKARKNQPVYEQAANATGVPWQFIAALQSLEASGDITKHLHNGDPLTGRTRNVPSGRPTTGSPPFTWMESAIDALQYDGLAGKPQWTLALMLYRAEKFNGLGYRKYHPEVPTPYLWSGTNHYKSGKYVADGKWSSTAVSQQIGVAPILKALMT